MAIERRLFIAESAEELIYVHYHCDYIGNFDNGKMYCDNSDHKKDMWYIDNEILEKFKEEIYQE